jgi:predicted  nucleic acid-binding Zn-ribbon protein
MPTLEERLEALEHALSAMKSEHIYDVRQLDERISALHEQIAEQRKRLSEQEQAIGRLGQTIDAKFDGLMKVLVQHSNAVNARLDAQDSYLRQNFATVDARFTQIDGRFTQMDDRLTQIDGRFTQVDDRFTRLEKQIDQQTVEIKAKFETSDLYATRTWGVVQSQEQDIREVKERLGQIVNLLTGKPEE